MTKKFLSLLLALALFSCNVPAYASGVSSPPATDANLSTSDITTNNVVSTKHGFAPKTPNDTTKFLRGGATADWAAPATQIIVTTITGSGTFTTNAKTFAADIECVGGGGGGGSADTGSSVGMGGAAGGYSKRTVTAATLGASQSVTIGAAGAASGSGGGSAGGAGGNTTFGALVTANGGSGGTSANTAGRVGVSGGTASGGDINVTGADAQDIFLTTLSGDGANSVWGAGGAGKNSAGAGNACSGKGSGGGGAFGTSPVAGAAGCAGQCIVTEYATQ